MNYLEPTWIFRHVTSKIDQKLQESSTLDLLSVGTRLFASPKSSAVPDVIAFSFNGPSVIP